MNALAVIEQEDAILENQLKELEEKYKKFNDDIAKKTKSALEQMRSDYEAEYARIEDIIASIEVDIDLNGGVGTAKQYEDLMYWSKELARLKS